MVAENQHQPPPLKANVGLDGETTCQALLA